MDSYDAMIIIADLAKECISLRDSLGLDTTQDEREAISLIYQLFEHFEGEVK